VYAVLSVVMLDINMSQHFDFFFLLFFFFFFFFCPIARVQHIFGDLSKLKHEYFWGTGSIVII